MAGTCLHTSEQHGFPIPINKRFSPFAPLWKMHLRGYEIRVVWTVWEALGGRKWEVACSKEITLKWNLKEEVAGLCQGIRERFFQSWPQGTPLKCCSGSGVSLPFPSSQSPLTQCKRRSSPGLGNPGSFLSPTAEHSASLQGPDRSAEEPLQRRAEVNLERPGGASGRLRC